MSVTGCSHDPHAGASLYCEWFLQETQRGSVDTTKSPRCRLFSPSLDLEPYVRRYYLFESPDPGITQIGAAWTKQQLVFQYGNRLRSSLGGKVQQVPNAAVNGAITRPYFFQPDEGLFRFFVVEFTDGGIYALLHENGATFVDTTVDALSVVPGRVRRSLGDALYEIDDLERKVILTERFLRELVPAARSLARIRNVLTAVDLMYREAGWISIQEIVAEIDTTERHLRRQFREVTGLAPKVFARILRFNGAIDTLLETGQRDHLYIRINDKATSDYADQAHFNHEFKEFTGYAPGDLPMERFEVFRVYARPEAGST